LYLHIEYNLELLFFHMVSSYNLNKLHIIINDHIPFPFPSLFSFYKQVLPIVIKQATNPSIYFKTSLPEKTK
jgi:hypothetical protein